LGGRRPPQRVVDENSQKRQEKRSSKGDEGRKGERGGRWWGNNVKTRCARHGCIKSVPFNSLRDTTGEKKCTGGKNKKRCS